MILNPIGYLATPYHHKFPQVMELRYVYVTLVAGKLMAAGQTIYSPISQNHSVAQAVNLPRTWEFWGRMDIAFLDKCSVMYVLDLKGWRQSVGVKAEIKYAKLKGIPVIHLDPKEFGIFENYPCEVP